MDTLAFLRDLEPLTHHERVLRMVALGRQPALEYQPLLDELGRGSVYFMASKYPPPPKGFRVKRIPYKTQPDGTRTYAKQYGKKAFCWLEPIVPEKK